MVLYATKVPVLIGHSPRLHRRQIRCTQTLNVTEGADVKNGKKLRQKHHNEYTVTQVEKVETLKKEFLQCPEGEQLPKREK